MSERDIAWQERSLQNILFSNADPISKVQQIVRIGFDPEIAEELVERHQIGSQAPVYYESLSFDDDYVAEGERREQSKDEEDIA